MNDWQRVSITLMLFTITLIVFTSGCNKIDFDFNPITTVGKYIIENKLNAE